MTPALDVARCSKAAQVGADIGVVDLEDSVPPSAKDTARRIAVEFFAGPRVDKALWGVRINGLRTREGLRDILALLDGGARPDLIFVPKVESPQDLLLLEEVLSPSLPETAFLAIIETARGVKEADEIAVATRRLRGLVFGSADMSASLGASGTWESLLYARHRIVLAAALGGLAAIDTAFFDLEDARGLAQEIRQVRELGFVGKFAIHPRQITAIQEGFSPSPQAVAHARQVVARASEGSEGIYVVQGAMIGPPILAMARRVLALAQQPGGETGSGAVLPAQSEGPQTEREDP